MKTTDKKTLESNKLIAEFMGIPFLNDAPKDYPKGYYHWEGPMHIDEFEYNSSWDWLIAVVIRINSLKDSFGNEYKFTIGNGYVWVEPHLGGTIYFSGNEYNHREEPMITKVYRGVIKFIEWYNKNK